MPEPPEVWTIETVLRWTTQFFREKHISSPRLDAELLLAHTLRCERLQLYLQADRPLTNAERETYRDLVRRRAARTPVAYLLGYQEFWNLRLAVSAGALIPRPDTETLVEAALEHLPEGPQRLLEVGTGTAAIPLALCAERTDLHWLCIERSPQAVEVARRNRANYAELLAPRRNRLQLLQGDGLSALRSAPAFDALVSNPPYIASKVIATLQPEVARYEPHLALDGGEDGLFWYRQFLQEGPRLLRAGGWLIAEIGSDQEAAVTALVQANAAWKWVGFRRDLQQHPRVLLAQLL